MKVGDKVRLVGKNTYYNEGVTDEVDPDNKHYKEGSEGTIVQIGEAHGQPWYDIAIPGSAHSSLTYLAREFEVIE